MDQINNWPLSSPTISEYDDSFWVRDGKNWRLVGHGSFLLITGRVECASPSISFSGAVIPCHILILLSLEAVANKESSWDQESAQMTRVCASFILLNRLNSNESSARLSKIRIYLSRVTAESQRSFFVNSNWMTVKCLWPDRRQAGMDDWCVLSLCPSAPAYTIFQMMISVNVSCFALHALAAQSPLCEAAMQ